MCDYSTWKTKYSVEHQATDLSLMFVELIIESF